MSKRAPAAKGATDGPATRTSCACAGRQTSFTLLAGRQSPFSHRPVHSRSAPEQDLSQADMGTPCGRAVARARTPRPRAPRHSGQSTSNSRSRSRSRSNKSPSGLRQALLGALILAILVGCVSCVVVYQVRFIATKNGRTDYALAGESVELSCHYIMKDEAEDIKQVIWSKDGKNFLKWNKNRPGLEVLSYTFKGHIDPHSKQSHLTIHNVTIDMHGNYKCLIKTDLGAHEAEHELVVVSQPGCKLNDWRVTSEPSDCREHFRLDCRNMFPKPVTSCGLWNSKLDKFIRSVVVDISEEPNRQTYRIRYSDRFELPSAVTVQPNKRPSSAAKLQQPKEQQQPSVGADLLQFAGHLMFKCDIIVPETGWKLSIAHRMFDTSDACLQDPLEAIERMRHNYSLYAASHIRQAGYLLDRQPDEFEMLTSNLSYELLAPLELNCWHKPKIGTLARLSCASQAKQVRLVGANLLECRATGWVPVGESRVSPKRHLRARKPPRASRRADSLPASDQDNDDSDDSSNAQPVPISTDLSLAPKNSNDLEEETTTTHMHTDRSGAGPTEAPDARQTTTEMDTIPTTQQILTLEHQGSHWPPANQLASLLPTCISSSRRQHQHQTVVSSNRLPLSDEGLRAAGSSSPGKSKGDLVDTILYGSIFNFTSSGSKSTVLAPGALALLLTLASLGAAMLVALQPTGSPAIRRV